MTTIALLSDIHIRAAYREEIIETLHAIRSELNSDTLAHTFVLGDLIEDDTKKRDSEHIGAVKSILDSFPSPVTYLLGNHDVGTLSRDELSAMLNQDRFFGQTNIDGQQIIYLDSASKGDGARGTLGTEQRNWLCESADQDAIILDHHPLGNFSLAENPWFQDYPERAYLWDRKECLQILEDRAVVTISGHIHQTGRDRFRDLTHWSINAVSKERPEKPVSGTYGVLSLGSQIELTIMRDGTDIESLVLTN